MARRINQSKINDPRFWAKWQASGAVGTIEAVTEKIAKSYDKLAYEKFNSLVQRGGAYIDSRGINFENGMTTLSIGKERINQCCSQPVCYLVVPNDNGLKAGQTLTELPRGAVSVERVYGASENKSSLYIQRKPVKARAIQQKIRQPSVQRQELKGRNYLQTNQNGYVTGIVQEEILIGLFGGTRTKIVDDQQAENLRKLLTASHRQGEGVHIDDVVDFSSQE